MREHYPHILGGTEGFGVADLFLPTWFTKSLAKRIFEDDKLKENLTLEIKRMSEGVIFFYSDGKPYKQIAWPAFCKCCGVHHFETDGDATSLGIDFHQWTEGYPLNHLGGHNIDSLAQAVVLLNAWARYFYLIQSLASETSASTSQKAI